MAGKEVGVKLRIDGDSKGAQQAASATARELEKLGEAADSAGRMGATGIDNIGNAAERAEAKAKPATRKIADGIKSISEQLSEVKMLYAAWIGAQQAGNAVAGIAATADAYANLSARIKLAVGDGENFRAAFQGVQDVALHTNTSLESTGVLFAKLAAVGKQMGLGQTDALRLTETINQAIQLSGSSAQASEAAVTQLIQALQSGVLRGDEFNSVMEQAPRLAQALASGLGKTTGKLREMAEAGQLSSETVISAMAGQAAAIESEFGRLPKTIGRAITDLQTQWQLWIGGLDESSGASRSAADAIELLAKNFDLVASSLINAGQAYLGWKAYNIAAEFIGLKTAIAASTTAKTIDTAATVANTTATAANTTAQIANNAAKASAVGSANNAAIAAGRLASALSLLKGLSFAFLLTNIVDIGKWLGEAAAKAMGYGKAVEDTEIRMRALEAATKAQRDVDAELAQKARLAADAKLGLSERSKALIADFTELTKKGGAVVETLEKLAKSLDLSSIQGIADAGAALDALAERGKISAEQVRISWRQALDGKDLQVFEANARAAFDDSEQGARRLAAALDAQLGEALRRTGLDAGALSAGVNEAAQTAINDFDVLLSRLDDMKSRGVDAGIALAASLDQAGKAATTEAAAQAVIDRWKELGDAGLVTGEKLTEGLEQAQKKLDDLKPGINSLAEAFRTLGMKTPAELKKTAEAAEAAFTTIKNSGDYSATGVNNAREAFKRYAEAAITANGGVASEMIKAQAWVNGFSIEVDNSGKAMVRASGSASAMSSNVESVADQVRDAGDAAAEAADQFSGLSSAMNKAATTPNASGVRGPYGSGNVGTGAQGYSSSGDSSHVIFNARDEAIKAGATVDNVEELTRLIQFEIEKATVVSGGQFPSERERDMAAARAVQALKADRLSENRAAARPAAIAPAKLVQIDLRGAGNKRSTVYADDSRAADELIKMLEESARNSI